MSSSIFNPGSHSAHSADWAARLIPGVAPAFRGKRKKLTVPGFSSSAIYSQASGQVAESTSRRAVALLLPSPLIGRTSRKCLQLVAADFAIVSLNWLLLGAARVSQGYPVGDPLPWSLLGTALLHAALISLLGFSEGLYDAGSNLQQQGRILGKSVLWATGLLTAAYLMQGARPNLIALLVAVGLLDLPLLIALRWLDQRSERIAGQHGRASRNVLIVGAGVIGRLVAAHLEHHPEEGRAVCGFLDDERPMGNGVIGRVSNLARLARQGFVDELLLAAPHDRELTLRVLHEARRLRLDVEMVPELFGCCPEGAKVQRVGGLPVICLHEECLPAAGLMAKRAFDIVAASGALLILVPLLAIIAGLIKADSPGPVLYAAPRAGRKGRFFPCYKFRTMVSNAEKLKNSLRNKNQRSGPVFKIAADPRITKVGRWLRRYSLDELPQLWNVLRGEMSLVGPRPHPLDDFAAYQVEDLARLDVTPGITGLWQVTARRDPSFKKGLELDREYIRNWSLGMDARILLKTISAVVRGSGD